MGKATEMGNLNPNSRGGLSRRRHGEAHIVLFSSGIGHRSSNSKITCVGWYLLTGGRSILIRYIEDGSPSIPDDATHIWRICLGHLYFPRTQIINWNRERGDCGVPDQGVAVWMGRPRIKIQRIRIEGRRQSPLTPTSRDFQANIPKQKLRETISSSNPRLLGSRRPFCPHERTIGPSRPFKRILPSDTILLWKLWLKSRNFAILTIFSLFRRFCQGNSPSIDLDYLSLLSRMPSLAI